MKKHRLPAVVYIGVGSNIEAADNVRHALELLLGRLAVSAVSPFYRSRAAGGPGAPPQPDFTNGVFAARIDLPPRALKFDVFRPLEERLGRARTADKNAARTIDLDLLLCGEAVLAEPGLTVPDPGVRRYPFVALPLLDLEPDLVLPDTGERLRDLFPGRPEEYGLEPLVEFTAELRSLLPPRGRR
jgi:2-amino-4-hydroxy-6-hydroxymethyldihydropteridine diphosphokinase